MADRAIHRGGHPEQLRADPLPKGQRIDERGDTGPTPRPEPKEYPMSTTRPLAVLIGGAVGGVAAVLAYGVLAPSAGSDAIASVSSVSPAAAEVVYDPCVAPAMLEGDTCVTRVTVTKPAAVAVATTRKAAPVSARHAAPTSTPTHVEKHEDSEHEDSEHEGEDHEDSTHEDSHDEDSDD